MLVYGQFLELEQVFIHSINQLNSYKKYWNVFLGLRRHGLHVISALNSRALPAFSLSFRKVRPRNICLYRLESNNQQVVKLSKVQRIAEQTQQDRNTRCNGFAEQREPAWLPMPFLAFCVRAFYSLQLVEFSMNCVRSIEAEVLYWISWLDCIATTKFSIKSYLHFFCRKISWACSLSGSLYSCPTSNTSTMEQST